MKKKHLSIAALMAMLTLTSTAGAQTAVPAPKPAASAKPTASPAPKADAPAKPEASPAVKPAADAPKETPTAPPAPAAKPAPATKPAPVAKPAPATKPVVKPATAKPATKPAAKPAAKPAPATKTTAPAKLGVIAQFSTIARGTEARDENIALAVDHINGVVLAPGETFSLNETVGKRTKASGFKTAHVFLDAKVVNGVGGGVSQVTGTLFNAAALAGLKIVEVNPHSRPVAYLPLGRDATVAYGEKDLKFTNNTKSPIKIAYTFKHKKLTARFFGTPVPGRKISLRPRVHRLGAGKINAELYRVTKMNGVVVSKDKLLTHAYRWTPGAK